MASEGCYSENTRKEFADYVFTNEDAKYSYSFVRDVIGDFRGDVEKFYPCFYSCVSPDDIVFKNLSRRTSRILGFEVANYVVAHLTGSVVKESSVDKSDISYSPKVSIIKYLSGYVFGTVYRRIRRSQLTRNMLSVQCLSILLAGKSSCDETDSTNVFVAMS